MRSWFVESFLPSFLFLANEGIWWDFPSRRKESFVRHHSELWDYWLFVLGLRRSVDAGGDHSILCLKGSTGSCPHVRTATICTFAFGSEIRTLDCKDSKFGWQRSFYFPLINLSSEIFCELSECSSQYYSVLYRPCSPLLCVCSLISHRLSHIFVVCKLY